MVEWSNVETVVVRGWGIFLVTFSVKYRTGGDLGFGFLTEQEWGAVVGCGLVNCEV